MKKKKLTKKQVQELVERARDSKNRSAIFKEFAKLSGKRPNSIRNFYYAYLANHPEAGDKKAFCRFRKDDTMELVRNIILNSSQGVTVRSTCMAMAGGDRVKHLRFQNKYRAILRKEPHLIHQAVAQLEDQGYVVINPLSRIDVPTRKGARIIHMMPRGNPQGITDQDLTNLLMGFVRLVQTSASTDQVEMMKKQIDLLKKELDEKIGN